MSPSPSEAPPLRASYPSVPAFPLRGNWSVLQIRTVERHHSIQTKSRTLNTLEVQQLSLGPQERRTQDKQLSPDWGRPRQQELGFPKQGRWAARRAAGAQAVKRSGKDRKGRQRAGQSQNPETDLRDGHWSLTKTKGSTLGQRQSFQQALLGQLDIHMRKNEPGHTYILLQKLTQNGL